MITGDDYIDTFLQISLCHIFPVIPHRAESSFIYNISQFRAGSAGSHPGDFFKIDIVAEIYLLCMNPEDSFSSLKIRQFYRHPAVKSARTGKGRIQAFRTVGSCQDHNSGVLLKAVHFCKELVQCLFPLVIPPCPSVTFLTDGVDLIDKYDTGSFFLGLLERSRTLEAPIPTNISTNSDPDMEKKGTPDSPATAFASIVLPVPGGPTRRIPWAWRHRSSYICPDCGDNPRSQRDFLWLHLPRYIRKPDSFRGFYIYFALLFPIPKVMALGPPAFFMIFLEMYCLSLSVKMI